MERSRTLLLEDPSPDFAELVRVLKGEKPPSRVHLVELTIDEGVIKRISEEYLNQEYTIPGGNFLRYSTPNKAYFQKMIQVYYRLGYDYVPLWSVWPNHPAPRMRLATDTADGASGQRVWAEEGIGLINSWQDFNQFPWEDIRPDMSQFQIVESLLPPGMKIVVFRSLFEHILEGLLGFEGLFYNLHDQPKLVEAIFERWGQIVYDYYAEAIEMDSVGAIFHCDDLGYKTSTFISPAWIKKLFFPWLKRFADLAHDHNKTLWLHSCGNLYAQNIIEDLIVETGIDAFHSFQDIIMPVVEFKKRYGLRIATLGGVDIDKLTRLKGDLLRRYLKSILDSCMQNGRYAFGSGNSIANYIPLENYAALLDGARSWTPS